jgi:hypothetical protein
MLLTLVIVWTVLTGGRRSGLGLLFLIRGKERNKSKLVISGFPADNGILAEEQSNSLTVQFVERIFMKNATLNC